MNRAQKFLQPSFIIFLSVTASILYSYGTAFQAAAERFIGLLLAAVAIMASGAVVRLSLAGGETGAGRLTEITEPLSGERPAAPGPFQLRIFLFLALALGSAVFAAHRAGDAVHGLSAEGTTGSFIGTVDETCMRRYNIELDVTIQSSGRGGRALVSAPYDFPVNRGDVVAVFSKLRAIDPGTARNSPYLRGLTRRGITHVAYADDDSISIVTAAPQGRRESLRAFIGRSIDRHFSPKTASLLRALYFGNKNHLSKNTLNAYKKAGVMHVLAASGLHVGIVAAVPFMLLAPLRVGKRATLIITTALLCFYLYITDMPVSLVRAFIMFAAYAAQRLLDMDRGAVNTLFLSASAILMFAPYELYELGFQLTFGATSGILLFYRKFEKSLYSLPRFLRGSLAMTLAAQLPVFPIIFFQLGEINLIGPASNLVAVPGITFALAASLASHCAGAVSEIGGRIIAIPVDCVVELTSIFIDTAAASGGHFRPGRGSWILLIFYALLSLPLFVSGKKSRLAMFAIPLAFAGAWWALSMDASRSPGPRIIYEEAGKLLVLSDGNHALVHGNLSGAGTAIAVQEAIEHEGVGTIQLGLSETDYRSLSGASFLARRCIVSSCAIDSGFRLSKALGKLAGILERDRVRVEFRPIRFPARDTGGHSGSAVLFAPPAREGLLDSIKSVVGGIPVRITAAVQSKALSAVKGGKDRL